DWCTMATDLAIRSLLRIAELTELVEPLGRVSCSAEPSDLVGLLDWVSYSPFFTLEYAIRGASPSSFTETSLVFQQKLRVPLLSKRRTSIDRVKINDGCSRFLFGLLSRWLLFEISPPCPAPMSYKTGS
ncbi:hypothetical protein U1Q18_037268, partial [Sarracenia purpurea var. burkii]